MWDLLWLLVAFGGFFCSLLYFVSCSANFTWWMLWPDLPWLSGWVGECIHLVHSATLALHCPWQLLLPTSPQQLTAWSYLPRMPCWLGVGGPIKASTLSPSRGSLNLLSVFPSVPVALISLFPTSTRHGRHRARILLRPLRNQEWELSGGKILFPHQQTCPIDIWSSDHLIRNSLFPRNHLTASHLGNANVRHNRSSFSIHALPLEAGAQFSLCLKTSWTQICPTAQGEAAFSTINICVVLPCSSLNGEMHLTPCSRRRAGSLKKKKKIVFSWCRNTHFQLFRSSSSDMQWHFSPSSPDITTQKFNSMICRKKKKNYQPNFKSTAP